MLLSFGCSVLGLRATSCRDASFATSNRVALPDVQSALIRSALSSSQLPASKIGLLQLHGTGGLRPLSRSAASGLCCRKTLPYSPLPGPSMCAQTRAGT